MKYMEDNFYDREYYKSSEGDCDIKRRHPAKAREIRFLRSIVCPRRGEKLLDLGCGTGDYLAALSDRGAELWGIDISLNATSEAKRKVPQPDNILRGDACPLPFGDNEFDLVTAWGVIEHFPDIPNVIGEIKRVVKGNGKIAIMVPNAYYYKFVWDTFRKGKGPVKHQEIETLYAFGEWKELIEGAGLKVVDIFRHNKFNKPAMIIWLRSKLIPFYFANHFVFVCNK